MGVIAVSAGLRVHEGLFTADELDQLHALGSDWGLIGRLSRETSHGSTGFSWEIPRAAHPMVEAAARRMESALGAPDALAAGGGGALRFRRYSRGEGHPPHLDVYAIGGLSLVATALLVLEGPDVGGHTRFPLADGGPVEVQAKAGRLITWANHGPDGRPDPRSRHEGLPVLRGQKVTLTLFLYRPEPEYALPPI